MATTAIQFTPEEKAAMEAKIAAELKAQQDKEREQQMQDEIRNQILLAERNVPGKRYC